MKRILVTYATFAGSTAKVAQCIADELVQQGATVDVTGFGLARTDS